MVVRFESDAWFQAWLTEWSGQFDWDQGNTGKLSKHSLCTDLVEDLFEMDLLYVGRVLGDQSPQWKETRHMLIVRRSLDSLC